MVLVPYKNGSKIVDRVSCRVSQDFAEIRMSNATQAKVHRKVISATNVRFD